MKIIPITDFENEYAITDQGTVIDLSDNSVKIPYNIRSYNLNRSAVDLYKNGEFVFTITIRELVLTHFFKLSPSYYTKQINVDPNDYSPYNLEVRPYETHGYVNSYNLTKPAPIYRYSDNGVYLVNQHEIDEYMKVKNTLSEENRKRSKEKAKLSNKLKRKTPLPGTPEREAWAKERKLISKINQKLSYIEKCAQRMNVPFSLSSKDVLELYNIQNGVCIVSEENIDLNKIYNIIPKDLDLGYVLNNVDLIKTRRILKNFYKPRKLKPKNEVRLKQVMFRVSEDEFTNLNNLAKENGVTISEFIRSKM